MAQEEEQSGVLCWGLGGLGGAGGAVVSRSVCLGEAGNASLWQHTPDA